MKGLEQFEPDTFYHIINHAVGSEDLFRNTDNYLYFLKKYGEHTLSVCDTWAYCLMPNHIHLLIKTHEEHTINNHPKFQGDFHKLAMQPFSNLLNGYTKAFNKMYNRRGALWMDFTRRFKITEDSYLSATINYIHQNPVKHGFTDRPDEWHFSSYNSLISTKPTSLSRENVLRWFGGREEFIQFHDTQSVELNEEWESPNLQ